MPHGEASDKGQGLSSGLKHLPSVASSGKEGDQIKGKNEDSVQGAEGNHPLIGPGCGCH